MRSIGSEFSWWGASPTDRHSFRSPHLLYALGRDAVIDVCRNKLSDSARLFVPSYFCPQVVSAWEQSGICIARYPDDPSRKMPDWDLLKPQKFDAVLAVNYFGVRPQQPWVNWAKQHSHVTLIEDHTHDPASKWAMDSKAHFSFASLRKTMPIPDGAVLWSPRREDLPRQQLETNWTGSAVKLAAMMLKYEYLKNATNNERLKRTYRSFEIDGEELLETRLGQEMSPWSRALVEGGVSTDLRERRERNTKLFISCFEATRRDDYPELLFKDWPEGHCPFNPILVFDSCGARDACRSKLVASQIFPPTHWNLPSETPCDSKAWGLSQRVLTIPVDFRCNDSDIRRILTCLDRAVAEAASQGGKNSKWSGYEVVGPNEIESQARSWSLATKDYR